MAAVELLLKFVAGGSIVVAVTLLAKTRYPALSGIMMLFPAVTLVGYYFVGQTATPIQLQQITKLSIYGISTTFMFLLAFYYAQKTMSVPNSLAASIGAWVISAGALIGITRGI